MKEKTSYKIGEILLLTGVLMYLLIAYSSKLNVSFPTKTAVTVKPVVTETVTPTATYDSSFDNAYVDSEIIELIKDTVDDYCEVNEIVGDFSFVDIGDISEEDPTYIVASDTITLGIKVNTFTNNGKIVSVDYKNTVIGEVYEQQEIS